MTTRGSHIGLVQATGRSGGGVYNYTLCMIDALNGADPSIDLTLLRWPKMEPIPRDRFHSRWSFVDLPDAIRTRPSEIKAFLRRPGYMLERACVNRPAYDFLSAHQFDFLIHPVPHPFAFECGKPFLMAIHDLQHRLQPKFPEVSADGQWGYREYMYTNAVRYAEGLLVDSAVGREDVLECYPQLIDPMKIHILPFAPTVQRTADQLTDSYLRSVKTKQRLPDRYLFYPAQFWLHKNHARIVQALHEIKAQHGTRIPLVLVGSKKGLPYEQREQVFDYVMGLATQLGISDLIHYRGYVPDEDMPALYAAADALVMPTFFGPTNIPIYEAWEFGCAVITSDIRGVREQVEDAGLLVDPCEPRSIAEAIRRVWTNEALRKDLIRKGKSRLRGFSQEAFRTRVLEILEQVRPAIHPVSAKEPVSCTSAWKLKSYSSVGGDRDPPSPDAARGASVDVSRPVSDRKRFDRTRHSPDAGLMSAEKSIRSLNAKLPQLRERMALWYLCCNARELQSHHAGPAGAAFRRILNDRFHERFPPAKAPMAVRPLIQGLMTARLPEERLKYVMGLMLFLPAHELAERVDIRDLPEWFHEEFMRFILKPAGAFWDQAEQETAFQQMQRPLEAIHKSILQNPQDRLTQKLAMTFSENASFLSCYFSSQPLKSLLVQRGEILAFALRHRGCELNHRFPARRASSQPIRLGIYSRSIHACPETFATLPLLEYMNRAMFQVHLYVHHSDSNRIEEGARNMVDRFSVLPQSANQSAAIIRSDDLDYLIFANNLTSAYGPGVVLASHRLARTQMIQFCNPVTSGLPHIDRVLIGSLMLQGIGMENEFTEKRLIIEGSGLCFTVDLSPASSEFRISRHDLGIAPNRIVFLSGANLFKVTPRLRRTWARVLQGVPDSHLVLYPFGPAWAADYPKKAFIEEFTRTLVEHGLDPGRLVVLDTVKDREQVSAWNRIADIYLDAVPYSGATSLLDPLQAGLPPIVMEGRELRFAQAGALMKELGVSELVTRNEDEYLRLAVRLGSDKCLRGRLRGRIIERMSAGPGFLNPRQYGRRVSSALLSIFPDSISRTGRETGTPLASKVWQLAAVP